jgi:hypothetical protein
MVSRYFMDLHIAAWSRIGQRRLHKTLVHPAKKYKSELASLAALVTLSARARVLHKTICKN